MMTQVCSFFLWLSAP
uniref:Uncharacterized protein n=1 Tax=Arundo donax TaxID=35708 RepID=A0A0A9F0K4_ARUDO